MRVRKIENFVKDLAQIPSTGAYLKRNEKRF